MVAHRRCDVYDGLAFGVAVRHIGAGIEQCMHYLKLPCARGLHQRGSAHFIGTIDIGAFCQKSSDLLQIAVACSPHQQSAVLFIGSPELGTG